MRVTEGLIGLCRSRKGTLSLVLVGCVTALAAFGKLDSVAYAAVIATVHAIYVTNQASIDRLRPQP